MSPDRLPRVEALYHAALALPPSAREAFLAEACGGDGAVRAEVLSLIAHATTDSDFLAVDGIADLPPPVAPGDRLGPYTVIAFLGAGGMGQVYRARDARLERDVAIKVLSPQAAGPGSERRLLAEAQAASALNHPNILTVYDVGVREVPRGGGAPASFLYVVMELLDGESLRRRLARGPMPADVAIGVASQIAQGLAAAHGKGIVHRDLKPDNIFITPDDRIKILDFGLARRVVPLGERETVAVPGQAGATATLAGTVLGTAGYMAPEQVKGEPADERADFFAFGAILYELLSGRRAFAGDSAMEAMTAVLRDEPAGIAPPSGAIPPALERVMRRCLRKRAADRFQSARDLVFALSEVASAASVPGVPPAAPTPVPAPAPRRSMMAPLVLAAVLIVGLIVALGVWRSGRATGGHEAVKSVAVLPLKSLSADVDDVLSDGLTEELISSLGSVPGLGVISRTSVMTYKASTKALPDIARELNVDAIVEGSVRRSGGRVEVTVRLVDGRTDEPRWHNVYSREYRDVVALPGELTQAIAREMSVTMTPATTARLSGPRPVDPSAHEAYLRGRFFLQKGTEADIRKALESFQQATVTQADYAAAYAGIADAYTALRSTYLPPREVMPQARAAALQAVAIDPELSEAHVSLGGVLMFYDFDWAGAERELKSAIQKGPGVAMAHDYYGQFLAAIGRPAEARAEMALARSLDPLSLPVMVDAGWVSYLGRDYDAMVRVNQQAIDLDAAFWPSYRDLGLGYEKVARFGEAIKMLEKARSIDGNSTVLEMLGGAYAAAGQVTASKAVIDDLTRQASRQYICPYEIATVHACLGDRDAAIRWLEKGLDERADCMPWAMADPKFDGLRADPRFDRVLRRMGLPR